MDCSFASTMLKTRTAGVLLHVSSLPGKHGVGDLGAGAREFVDWLAACKAGLWQILPLNPNGRGNAPYSSWSAFCGNPLFIDLDSLFEDGLLDAPDLKSVPMFPTTRVDFEAVAQFKMPLLHKAARKFLRESRRPSLHEEFESFRKANAGWLEDAILFRLIREENGGMSWWDWPKPLRDRDRAAVRGVRVEHEERFQQEEVIQFFFDRQWRKLRAYAAERGVRLVGDVPIYVDRDSADVWSNPEMFKLDKNKTPTVVSGVPPDAFSALGQLWGNPIFDWKYSASKGYSWWVSRFNRVFSQTDVVRIDHFRGFSAYWEIPYGAPDARAGEWVPGPSHEFIKALKKAFNGLPFIAEDLGIIDDEVRSLRDDHDLPGMLVLQFAFGGKPTNEYLTHNHLPNRVVYPGTHDNRTLLGWWRTLPAEARNHVREYVGISPGGDEGSVVWALIHETLKSVADWAVIPAQDLLELGDEARMNDPAVGHDGNNWVWRMEPGSLGAHVGARFARALSLYDRARLLHTPQPESARTTLQSKDDSLRGS